MTSFSHKNILFRGLGSSFAQVTKFKDTKQFEPSRIIIIEGIDFYHAMMTCQKIYSSIYDWDLSHWWILLQRSNILLWDERRVCSIVSLICLPILCTCKILTRETSLCIARVHSGSNKRQWIGWNIFDQFLSLIRFGGVSYGQFPKFPTLTDNISNIPVPYCFVAYWNLSVKKSRDMKA